MDEPNNYDIDLSLPNPSYDDPSFVEHEDDEPPCMSNENASMALR